MTLGRRLTLILGFGELITWGLTYYIPAVMTLEVAGAFGVGAGAVLGGFSLALLVTGLASPPVCRWIDRFGGRAVMVAGVLVQAAGLLVMAGAPGLWGWYLGWGLVGLGMSAGLYDAAFATAGRAMGAGARPVIAGIAMIGGLASTLGWPLGWALMPVLGWRGTLVCYAGILVATNLPLFLMLPRGVPGVGAGSVAVVGPMGEGRWAFLGIAVFFTVRAGLGTVISVSGLVLLAGLGIEPGVSIALVSLIGPAQVGMRILQAAVGRGWNPVLLTWIGAVVMPAVCFGVVLAAGGAGVVAAAGAFAVGYGMSNGILTIARGTLPLLLFGPQGYATRIGQLAMPVMLAQAASPLLAAPVISGWAAGSVFLAMGVLALAGAAFLLPLHWGGGRRRGC